MRELSAHLLAERMGADVAAWNERLSAEDFTEDPAPALVDAARAVAAAERDLRP